MMNSCSNQKELEERVYHLAARVVQLEKDGSNLPSKESSVKEIREYCKPSKPSMDWSILPGWGGWIAMDRDGEWFFYASKPNKQTDYWYSKERLVIPAVAYPVWVGSWWDSLVEVSAR